MEFLKRKKISDVEPGKFPWVAVPVIEADFQPGNDILETTGQLLLSDKEYGVTCGFVTRYKVDTVGHKAGDIVYTSIGGRVLKEVTGYFLFPAKHK
jgi:hypothetical protein